MYYPVCGPMRYPVHRPICSIQRPRPVVYRTGLRAGFFFCLDSPQAQTQIILQVFIFVTDKHVSNNSSASLASVASQSVQQVCVFKQIFIVITFFHKKGKGAEEGRVKNLPPPSLKHATYHTGADFRKGGAASNLLRRIWEPPTHAPV